MKRVLIAVFALLFLAGGPREKPRPIVVPPMTGAEEFTTMRHLVKQLNDAFDAIYEGVRSKPEVYYGIAALDYGTSPCDTVIITNFDGDVRHYKCDTCFVPQLIAVTSIAGGPPITLVEPDSMMIGANDVVGYRIPAMVSDSSFSVCFGNTIASGVFYLVWMTVGR